MSDIYATHLSSRRSRQDASIRTFRIRTIVGNLPDTATRLNARVSWALEHASVGWRVQSLQNVAEGVPNMGNSLTLSQRLVDFY